MTARVNEIILDTKEYEVTIYVDGMMEPNVATLTIEGMNAAEAKRWVRNHMRLIAKEVKV